MNRTSETAEEQMPAPKRLFLLFTVMLLLIRAGISGHGDNDMKEATFAGGCFWCMEPPFENLEGVTDVVAGYTGGHKDNPSYDEVSSGKTGHLEAVQITYDPSKITYSELLDIFWKSIDPTDSAGQFADKGSQYKTAIFYHDDEQKRLAEKSKTTLEESGKFKKPIVTGVVKASRFYKAEDHHQDYYKTNRNSSALEEPRHCEESRRSRDDEAISKNEIASGRLRRPSQ